MRRCEVCGASFLEDSLYSEHCSLHQQPGELAQCSHCLLFLSQSEVEAHANPGQCQHYQERERLQSLASHLQGEVACSHLRSGCQEKLPGKLALHSHAKICSSRPPRTFQCSVRGCQKRYYYNEDFEKHVKKHNLEVKNHPENMPSIEN